LSFKTKTKRDAFLNGSVSFPGRCVAVISAVGGTVNALAFCRSCSTAVARPSFPLRPEKRPFLSWTKNQYNFLNKLCYVLRLSNLGSFCVINTEEVQLNRPWLINKNCTMNCKCVLIWIQAAYNHNNKKLTLDCFQLRHFSPLL
jgi:hypothetical protein